MYARETSIGIGETKLLLRLTEKYERAAGNSRTPRAKDFGKVSSAQRLPQIRRKNQSGQVRRRKAFYIQVFQTVPELLRDVNFFFLIDVAHEIKDASDERDD